ncbi:MAG: rane protein [Proteobacteria bacterium]|nr:rane protein [Pseudomonadota bacterium]
MSNLRRYLIAGLLVWLPIVVTVLILKFLIDLVDRTLLLLPAMVQPETLIGFRIPGLGFLLSGVVLLVTGIVVTNLLGSSMVKVWESLLARIPVVRAIYSASKQLTETLFSGSGKSFRKVVMVRYPHPGMWTLAFLTGDGMAEANRKTGRDLVNIFVPTTPNPTSGFFLMVPREDMIELDMPVDVGIKLILSAGAVSPEGKPEPAGD